MASYSSTLPATAAFRLSTAPGRGMVTRASAWAIQASGSPEPSLPTSSALGPRRSASLSPSRATAAKIRTPLRRRAAKASSAVMAITGSRKADPEDARRVLAFHRLTVPGSRIMPVAPKASAERTRVPRFPGSCRPAAMTTRGMPSKHRLHRELGRFHQGGDALGMLREWWRSKRRPPSRSRLRHPRLRGAPASPRSRCGQIRCAA